MLAYIALGSNLGDRWAHLRGAVRALADLGAVTAISPVWETAAVASPAGAGDFLNAVVALETSLAPSQLLPALLRVEGRAGRVRGARNAPRTLDLDLLLAGDAVIESDQLTLPHPRLAERRFVLAPLVAIAPDAIHPVLHRSMAQLLAALADDGAAAARRLADPL